MGKKRKKKRKVPKGNKFTIKSSDLTIRNLFHFEVQRNTRMQIQEDKRYKKPKYKNKGDDDSSLF